MAKQLSTKEKAACLAAYEAAQVVTREASELRDKSILNQTRDGWAPHVADAYSRLADSQRVLANAITGDIRMRFADAAPYAASAGRFHELSHLEAAAACGSECLDAVLAAADFPAWQEWFDASADRPARPRITAEQAEGNRERIAASVENHGLLEVDRRLLEVQLYKEVVRVTGDSMLKPPKKAEPRSAGRRLALQLLQEAHASGEGPDYNAIAERAGITALNLRNLASEYGLTKSKR